MPHPEVPLHSLPKAPLRVAVVGAGVSGLVAARELSRRHQITVFEADARVGGHAHTVDVEDPLGRVPVDTGFIVYNERTYPAFSRLLRELDVETRPTTMSFSVRCDVTNLEYNGDSFRTLFAQRRNLVRPRFWRLLRDVHRFYRHGEAQVGAAAPDTTVAEFVARHGYGREFVDQHLLPLGAAIWSSPPGTFARFPVRFVVDFLARHDLLELDLARRVVWRTVVGGSRAYVDRLVAPFRDRIRTSCPVRTIERDELGVTLRLPGGAEERFDHVVLACHSDQALRLLARPTPEEREILGAIPYERNATTLHRDPVVLPRRPRVRAAWNYRISPAADRPTLTYDLRVLQGLRARDPLLVSVNEDDRLDPEAVLGRYDYAHPVYTAPRERAQARLPEIQGRNHTSFAGAYWGAGFHEDGTVSGTAAAESVERAARRRAEAA